jgi:dimethylaniline monooxygenase (N-oxide forming)
MSARLSGRRVAVVGAGPGGVTAAKSLVEEGFEPTVFEQSRAVGGQWNIGAPHSGVWPGMRANTSKFLSAFSDFPPPDDWTMFARAEQLQAYYAAYADRFGVTPTIRFGARVANVEQVDGGYRLSWTDASGSHSSRFDGVVVASGRYNTPSTPDVEGLGTFTGRGGVHHSFDYAGRDELAGQRVVVLGNSISGLELASDLAVDDSITVYSAFRKPRYIIPRVALGVPSDCRFLTRINAYLPLALPMDAVAAGFKQAVLEAAGHPSQYGAPAPHDNIFVADLSMCQDWLSHVAHGRLQVKPNVVRVDGRSVHFEDGTSAEADTFICATGFDVNLPFLSPAIHEVIRADSKTLDLYQHTFHPDLPGLAFVGFYYLVGPYAPVLELQGRWIATAWSDVHELPDRAALLAGIDRWRQQKRVTSDVFLHDLAVALAVEAGVEPRLERRSELTRALLFGPLAPAQFRLDGHGSRPDALDLYKKAVTSFGGDLSPVPTPEQLGLLGTIAEALGDRMPELSRAHDVLKRLAVS